MLLVGHVRDEKVVDVNSMAVWQDCIVVVLAHHAGYDTTNPEYVTMPEGCKLRTFLVANIGKKCFARYSLVNQVMDDMMQEGYYHRHIRYILEAFSGSVKPFDLDPFFSGEEYPKFLECGGETCSNENEYYNKRWHFPPYDPEYPDDLGCILLYTQNGDKIHKEEIGTGVTMTKKELIDALTTKYKNILMLDLSCNFIIGSPEQIQTFKARGAIGGKKTKRKSSVRRRRRKPSA